MIHLRYTQSAKIHTLPIRITHTYYPHILPTHKYYQPTNTIKRNTPPPTHLIHGDGQKDDVEEYDDQNGSYEGEGEAVLMGEPAEVFRAVSRGRRHHLGDDDSDGHDHGGKSVTEGIGERVGM